MKAPHISRRETIAGSTDVMAMMDSCHSQGKWDLGPLGVGGCGGRGAEKGFSTKEAAGGKSDFE